VHDLNPSHSLNCLPRSTETPYLVFSIASDSRALLVYSMEYVVVSYSDQQRWTTRAAAIARC
jgi:hypothetical protein